MRQNVKTAISALILSLMLTSALCDVISPFQESSQSETQQDEQHKFSVKIESGRPFGKVGHIKTYSLKNMTEVSEHEGCQYTGETHDLPSPWQQDEDGARLLQTAEPRNMRILTYFPEETTLFGVNVAQLQKNYQIAAHYYETVFKVKPFPANTDTRTAYSTCGTIPVPSELRTQGFNPQTTDTVILATIYSQAGSSTLAFAGPCDFMRRPVISQINFNAENMNRYLDGGDYQYHQLVIITMHEMGHIFGVLGGNYYDRSWRGGASALYKSPDSNTRYKFNEIIDNSTGTPMMILPGVRDVVSSHFNCNTRVGAKMSSSMGHWDGAVFARELMTPSIGALDNRVTPLTLSLYKETGWYADVDMQTSWALITGKGEGCDFMEGTDLTVSGTSACSGTYSCDPAHTYGGRCNNDGSVSAFSNKLCQSESIDGRCFVRSNNFVYCLDAVCETNTRIRITSGSASVLCRKDQNTQFSINGGTYDCPDDYATFCGAEIGCEQWCGEEGFCVDGTCHFDTCQNKISGCQSCTQKNREPVQCLACQSGLQVSSSGQCISQVNCSSILGCQLCNSNSGALTCNACQGDRHLVSNSCPFKSCGSAIPKCNQCNDNDSDNLLSCTSCNAPYVAVNGQCQAPACDSVIPGCSSCYINNANTVICEACSGDLTLASPSQCQPPSMSECSSIIASCNSCSFDSQTNDLNCNSCDNGLVVSSDGERCEQECLVNNCATCASGNNQLCETCAGNRFVFNNYCYNCPCNNCAFDRLEGNTIWVTCNN